LHEDAAEIFADHAQKQRVERDPEQQEQRRRGKAGRPLLSEGQPPGEVAEDQQGCRNANCQPDT